MSDSVQNIKQPKQNKNNMRRSIEKGVLFKMLSDKSTPFPMERHTNEKQNKL